MWLAGCGLALTCAGAAHAQAFQATPTTIGGSVVYDRGTPGSETIQVLTPTAVVNWTPTDNSGTGTIDLLPQGNVARFDSSAGIGDAYTILNRIVPANTGRAVSIDGMVQAFQGGTATHGGAVWFYSPGGIIVGPDARFDVGRLMLTANDVVLDGSNNPYGAGGKIQLRAASNSTSGVTISAGAQINATEPGSYIALVAPRITQSGAINVNGAAALVAAESVDMIFAAGLFDINVLTGATGGTTILTHNGTTSGPSSTGTGDPHRMYMVAVSKNSAITMLLGGTIGYAASGSASIDNGAIILAAGRDISGGDPPAAPANIGATATLDLTGLTATAPIKGFASGTLTGSGTTLPIGRLDAGGPVTLSSSTISGTGAISTSSALQLGGPAISTGDLTAPSVTINATGTITTGIINAVNDIAISGGGAVRTGAMTSGDDIIVGGQSVDLQALTANTSGSDNDSNGRNIAITTTSGLLKLTNANAATNITLQAASNAGIQASALTSGGSISVSSTGNGAITLDTLDAGNAITLASSLNGAISGTNFHAGGAIHVTGHSTLTFGDIAGRSVQLVTDDAIGAHDITANDGLTLTAGTDVTVNSLLTGNDIVISGSSVDALSMTANTSGSDTNSDGRNIRITATSGPLHVASATASTEIALTENGTSLISATSLTAGRSISAINLGDGALALSTINAGSDITLRNDGAGTITTSTLQAGGTLSITGVTGIGTGDLTARRVALSATGAIGAADITASDDVDVTSSAGAVTLTRVQSGDDITISGRSVDLQTLQADTTGSDNDSNGRNIAVTATGGLLKLTTASASTDITLTGNSAAGIQADTLTAGRSIVAHSIGNGALALSALTAGSDIILTGDGSGAITASTIQGGGAVRTRSNGNVQLGDITGLSIDLGSTTGPISAHNLTANNDLIVNTTGTVTLADLRSGDDITIGAGSVDLQSLTANTSGSDNDSNGRNIAVTTTTGLLKLTTASASTDIALTTSSAAGIQADSLTAGRFITAHSINDGVLALSALTAGSDIDLTADGVGTVTATTVQSGGRVRLRSQTDVDLGDIAARAVDFGSTSGPIVAHNVTASDDIDIASGGDVTLATLLSGDDITISGRSVDLQSLTANTSGSDNDSNGRNIAITTTTGLLKLTTVDASTSITLNTAGAPGIQADTLTAGFNLIAHSSGDGALALSTISAGNDLQLLGDGAGTITANSVQANARLEVNGQAAVSLGDVRAGTLMLSSASGPLSAHDLIAVNDATITSNGAITASHLSSGDDIAISGGSVDLTDLTANTSGSDNDSNGRNITVSTSTGLLRLAGATASNLIALATSGNAGIDAGALTGNSGISVRSMADGPILLGTVSAPGGPIALTGDGGGTITATMLQAGGALTLNAHAPASLGTIVARSVGLTSSSAIAAISIATNDDLTLTTNSSATIGAISVGDDIAITAQSADLASLTADTSGSDNDSNGRNIAVTTTTGLLNVGQAIASTDITLLTGSAAGLSAATLTAGRSIETHSSNAGSIALGTLTAGNAIILTGDAAGAINSAHLIAGNSIQLNAHGPASLGIVEGGRIGLVSSSSIDADTMRAVNDIDIDAASVTGNDFRSGDDITIGAQSVVGGGFHVDTSGSDNESDGRNIRITTNGLLHAGPTDAATDVMLTSTGGLVDVTDPVAGRTLSVEGASVRAASSLDLTLTNALASHGDLTLVAARDVILPATAFPGLLSVTAGGAIRVNGPISSAGLSLFSGDIVIGSAQISAPTIAIGSVGTMTTVIGGTGIGPGYRLSQAEFARLHAPSLTVAASTGTLTIDTLTPIGSGASTAGGVPNGTIGGTAGLLSFVGPTIEVVGPLLLTNALSTDRLQIAAADRLTVAVASGSIAVEDNAGALAGTLALRGSDVFVTTAKAATDLAAAADIVARTSRLAVNDGAVVNAGFIRADAIELAGGNRIYVQNSGGADTAQRAGFSAGTGGVKVLSTGADGIEFIVNGRIGSKTGGDVGPGIVLNDGGKATLYAANSSVNGCVVAATGCQAPTLPPDPAPPPAVTPPPEVTPPPTVTPDPPPTVTPPPAPPTSSLMAEIVRGNAPATLSQAQATIVLIQPDDPGSAPETGNGVRGALGLRGSGVEPIITVGRTLISGQEPQRYEFVTGFGSEGVGVGFGIGEGGLSDAAGAAQPDALLSTESATADGNLPAGGTMVEGRVPARAATATESRPARRPRGTERPVRPGRSARAEQGRGQNF